MTGREILLIDDNEYDVSLIQLGLEKAEVKNNLLVAKDGKEALEYLFNDNTKPQKARPIPALILLEIEIRDVDGFDLLKRIRSEKNTSLCPVVILTSCEENKNIVAAYRLGANSYICKPLDSEPFLEAVKQMGLYWLNLNESPQIVHGSFK